MLKTIIRRLLRKRQATAQKSGKNGLTTSYRKNLETFKALFADDDMVIFREFCSANSSKSSAPIRYCALFVNQMVDQELLNIHVIQPLMRYRATRNCSDRKDILMNTVIATAELTAENCIDDIAIAVLSGQTAILIEGVDQVLLADLKDLPTRNIAEPTTEVVTRGPKEAFVELLLTNLTMVRRRIKTPHLKFKFLHIGERTKTKVCICYIDAIANEKLIKEVLKRLEGITIDGILDSAYIDELIRDHPLSPYRTTNFSERPDSVAAKLLEGRAAIFVDGSPFALTVPFVFMEYLQNPEDYYIEYSFATFIRLVRIIGFFVAIGLPAIWVALTTFHPEMLPLPLLMGVYAARQAVPLPTILETILLVIIFDVLREIGARMPSPIGTTISFLGAIIIGQAAVEARLISPVLVVIVATTGIATFLLPKMYNPLALTRIYLLLCASFLGIYGYVFGMIGLLIHTVSMRSFGIPYLLGTGTLEWSDIRDTAMRAPWWAMYYRPKLIGNKDSRRMKPPD